MHMYVLDTVIKCDMIQCGHNNLYCKLWFFSEYDYDFINSVKKKIAKLCVSNLMFTRSVLFLFS